jgi:hypothetical protein
MAEAKEREIIKTLESFLSILVFYIFVLTRRHSLIGLKKYPYLYGETFLKESRN